MHGRRVSIKVVRGKARERTPFVAPAGAGDNAGCLQLVRQRCHGSRRACKWTSSTTRASISSIRKKEPKEAAKKLEEVDRQHPYSEWARKSLIMVGLCLLRGRCLRRLREFSATIRDVASWQPGCRSMRSFLIGSSYFDQIPEIPAPVAHRKGRRKSGGGQPQTLT